VVHNGVPKCEVPKEGSTNGGFTNAAPQILSLQGVPIIGIPLMVSPNGSQQGGATKEVHQCRFSYGSPKLGS
jgi:hypothetical protein